MIGRFSMGKQVSIGSMSKNTGKPVKAQTPGMYPKAVISRKVSKMNTPKMGMRKMGMQKTGIPMKKGF